MRACSSVDGVGESMPWAEPSASEVGSLQTSVLNCCHLEGQFQRRFYIVLVGPLQSGVPDPHGGNQVIIYPLTSPSQLPNSFLLFGNST